MATVTEQAFLASLDDLTGKVAIVTGGAGTIGAEVSKYLAARGCMVYVADTAPRLAAIATAREVSDWSFFAGQGKRVEGAYPDRIRHHILDLGSIKTATESATEFLAQEQQLDILVACAAVRDLPQSQLSPDGWERTWAIAHLGHVAFINTLLPLLRKSVTPARPSRIVFVTSNSYESAVDVDYEELRRVIPDDFNKLGFMRRGNVRYSVSKLGNVYYGLELAEQIRTTDDDSNERVPVLVNLSHPGVNGRTHLGHGVLHPWLEGLVKGMVALLSHAPRDCAKTGAFLAAGADVRLRRVTGEFWTPTWSWLGYWTGCHKVKITPLGLDVEKRKECWDRTEAAIAEARAGTPKQSGSIVASG